jgi:hypothetical protein
MKTDMRRELARQPFEEKIRKVGQLIKLSATMKSSRVREEAQMAQHPSRTADPFQGRASKVSSDPVS